MDTYQFTRAGYAGTFTVDAASMDEARQRASEFFKAVLSDFTWRKTIHVQSCTGCEDVLEPSEQEIERMLSVVDGH